MTNTNQQEQLYSRQDVINAWNSAYGGDSHLSGEDYVDDLLPSPLLEDGKQGGEDTDVIEDILSGYESVNVMTDYDHYEEHYHKDCVIQAMKEYKSLPSTPVQPGERINKVKDAIGFLLSCAYPEMIASEYNRNKEVLTEICKLIDTIATSTPAQDGWVRVEDGLPELYTTCMVTDAGTVDMAIYLPENRWEDKCNEGLNHVTHWQPLPSPPVNKH